jgi:hypothetical protein
MAIMPKRKTISKPRYESFDIACIIFPFDLQYQLYVLITA